MAYWRSLLLVLLLAASTAHADFNACRDRLRDQAREAGITSEAAMQAVAGVQQRERVIELDRSQPEFLRTFRAYLDRRVTDERVERGRRLLREHEALLRRVHRDYGVPPAYLVAFWGLETNFGDHFGGLPVLDALATLACDQRRSEFFTEQFLEALRIVDAGDMQPERMRGSWAGAMGHMQFMPSTFAAHAVDYDGSGRIDIWNSLADAFGSAGSYLRAAGWQPGERWGREVQLPGDFDYSQASLDTRRPIRAWSGLGVRTAAGDALPRADMDGSIVLPAGHDGPAFLVYDNFRVILRWNRSVSYAIAVGHLADRIRGLGGLHTRWQEEALSVDAVRETQELLNTLGHDAGEPDGLPGPSTRAAIRSFQQAAGRPADGHPDPALLEALREAVDTDDD
ncbi:lytic murein transglycosylase [Aquisalimonas lutea]|uniref:lytic murein transglycosylase n=1 Tax=Aquisalimonas lutea TaxID=1327750 RepID=UPI0025B3925E|nr:lytic murein transglycosylase [Aquisalimonas lutea]MDN3517949.1 lytic murein transglycosylase [Aquisalimonas lutea]